MALDLAIRPILSTLTRHRIAAGLIVLEVALALTVVCHALHMMAVRVAMLNQPTGLAETELVNIEVRAIAPIEQADALTQEDLRRLRALPGVKGVSISNQFVYSGNNNNSTVNTEANNQGARVGASYYSGDEHFLAVHGLRLIAGRNFRVDELQKAATVFSNPNARVPGVIVNRHLAAQLFPGQEPSRAVGKPIWIYGDQPIAILGVVDELTHTDPRGRRDAPAFIAPLLENFRTGGYVLRVEPGRQQAVLREAAQLIREIDPRRSVGRGRTLLEMRSEYFAEDRAMTGLLAGVCAALLAVTAFGIVGLASFWVEQRTRMIGVRRALGATRAQIRRYFQVENALLCGAGVLLGVLGAVAVSHFIMRPQGAPALPWLYLPVGALLLMGLGQLAVLAPARKAADLPAAAAMRA